MLISLEFRTPIIIFRLCCLAVKLGAFLDSLYSVCEEFLFFYCLQMYDAVCAAAPYASRKH